MRTNPRNRSTSGPSRARARGSAPPPHRASRLGRRSWSGRSSRTRPARRTPAAASSRTARRAGRRPRPRPKPTRHRRRCLPRRRARARRARATRREARARGTTARGALLEPPLDALATRRRPGAADATPPSSGGGARRDVLCNLRGSAAALHDALSGYRCSSIVENGPRERRDFVGILTPGLDTRVGENEKRRKRRCRFRDGLDGSARLSVALFDRAQQRRVNTAKQTPCPREVRTRPNSTRDVRRDVARRARTRRRVPASPACVARAMRAGAGADPRRRRRRGDRRRRPSRGGRGVCSVSMPRTSRAIHDATGSLERVAARAVARVRCARTRGFQKRGSRSGAGNRRRVPPPAAAASPRREAGRAHRRDPPGDAPRASRRASRPSRRPHPRSRLSRVFPSPCRSYSERR